MDAALNRRPLGAAHFCYIPDSEPTVQSAFTCRHCRGYGRRRPESGNWCLTLEPSNGCDACGGAGWTVPRWRAGLADAVDPLPTAILQDEIPPLIHPDLLDDLRRLS